MRWLGKLLLMVVVGWCCSQPPSAHAADSAFGGSSPPLSSLSLLSQRRPVSSGSAVSNQAARERRACKSLRGKIERLHERQMLREFQGRSTNRIDQQLGSLTERYANRCSSTDGRFCPEVYEPVCGAIENNLCHDSPAGTCIDAFSTAIHSYSNMCALMRAGATFLFNGPCYTL